MSEDPGIPRSGNPLVSATVKTLKRLVALGPLALALFVMPVASLLAQPTAVTVPTWRYDQTHAGLNDHETALTTDNVNVNTFGKLFALTVDGSVYAQPLYIPALKMSDGLVHNVLFVATENDSIYAFDADSNGGANANPIWKISLLTAAHGAGAGAVPVPYSDTASPDIKPTIGITGTPAINPATNTMYVVAATKENGAYFTRLHAINILTGAEQAHSPVDITASVAGTGNGSAGGQLAFSPLWANQRSALNYYNGYVYIAFAAHGDNGPYHGWLFSYNGTTLAQKAVISLSPNGYGSGIWSSGAGMPIDDDADGGRMFVATGNGTRTPNVHFPFSGNTGYGESVVAFNLSNGGLTATDEFTAFNKDHLNDGDLDLGSGGILMVPDQQGANPHILVVLGKEARITVLNRDNLGGMATPPPNGTSNTNALQDIMGQVQGCWCTPAYWNGRVYIWGSGENKKDGASDVAKMFDLDSGVMSTTPTSQSTITTKFPSPTFSISSNGAQEGIAWAVGSDQFDTHGPLVLYAWDATDLTTPIYESDTNAKRDAGGAANRFAVPVVTNGKVYVSANGLVDVYGLFNGEPNAAAPTITPNGGAFGASQKVTLSSTTPSADIYYTLDGTVPTPSSTLYTGPITINTDTTINAIASAAGYIQSGVSSATFTFSGQTPLLSFMPAAGTYRTAQQVTISNPDANAKIYYTIDGSTPSASSTPYSGPIPVLVSETIKAIAIDPNLRDSNVGTSVYVIENAGATIDFGSGFSSTTGLTLNGSALASNDTRLQLTDGGLQEAGSVFWNTPINIQAFTTDFLFQLSSALGNGFTFTIQNIGPTALGANAAGLGYQGIQKSVAVKFNFYNSNSTGVYTDGAAPTLPAVDLTPSGIVLASGDSIDAQVTYDGTTLTLNLHDLVTDKLFTMSQAINIPQVVGANTAYVGFTGSSGQQSSSQKILTWTYATRSVPPAFTPVAGTYSAAQNVVLSSATADAAIYYTVNGTTPTAVSTLYSRPIAVAASQTVQAIAISPTAGSSDVKGAAYVIRTPIPATFSLSGTSTAAITHGASTTSTITITPSGGFTGSVALACAITDSPSGALNPPTCSVTQPAAISGTGPVTSTLTIKTTGTSTAALHDPLHRLFTLSGGGTLAALLFICLPFRRHRWQTLFGLLLFLGIAAAATGCGGSNEAPPPTNPGTTAGSYTVTVTGTSGSNHATATVGVTVQ